MTMETNQQRKVAIVTDSASGIEIGDC